jgi:hypothetical protein
MSNLKELEARREHLKGQLGETGDMRPGTLVGRFRKCGKPSCHCAQEDSRGHGPSWSLTRAVGGKTVTRVIPTGPALERTREQIEAFQRFRELTRELVEVSVKICDERLAKASTANALGDTEAKKNGTRRRAGRRRLRGA